MASPFAFWGMDLTKLGNEELIRSLKSLKAREDAVLVDILEHIHEFERRQLYLTVGRPTLYSYLMEDMNYSENEAYRRIESSRFLKTYPELKPLVNEGRLTMTSISEVRSAVRAQEKITNQIISREEQVELAKSVLDCSKKETQKILTGKFPDYKPTQFERRLELPNGGVQITMRLTEPQRTKCDKTKDIMARTGPIPNTAILFEKLCDHYLKKKDLTVEPSTQRSLSRQETPRKNSANGVDHRKIPMPIRRTVFRRDRGRCQFKKPDGGTCNQTYNVEIDHIIPVSAGGTNDLGNLRCLCRAHNQWKSDKRMN